MASRTTRGVSFEDFDPNVTGGNKPLWGVFTYGKFRTYAQRGHAINALHQNHRVKLYVQTPTGWVLQAVKDPTDPARSNCDDCGGPLAPDLFDYEWMFERDLDGKTAMPLNLLCLCKSCKAARL